MRVVVQRVKQAKVFVSGKLINQIKSGFLVFIAISRDDTDKEVDWMVKKVACLRLMADKAGKMNWSLTKAKGEIMVVSQFTLYADCHKGNRPSFIQAAGVEKGKKLYNLFIEKLKLAGIPIKTGIFQAMMTVELVNDGPVTVIIDK